MEFNLNHMLRGLLARKAAKPTTAKPPFYSHEQHTNPKRNAERRLCKSLGNRQYRHQTKLAYKLRDASRRAQEIVNAD